MTQVDERVCEARHKTLNGAFKAIRETQDIHAKALDGLKEGQQTIIEGICGDPKPGGEPGIKSIAYSNRKWIKRFLVLLGAAVIAAATTLVTLGVTYLCEGKTNEVRQPVSGSVRVDPAD